jgi:hypothetical protein
MKIARTVAVSIGSAVLIASCGTPSRTTSWTPSPSESPSSASCAANFHELTLERTRSPVQIDLNAGYYQGTIGRYYVDGVTCKAEEVLSGSCAKRIDASR